MSEAIRKFAEFHGATSKYHHTITLVWMRLVAAALRDDPGIEDFDCFAGAHPEAARHRRAQDVLLSRLLRSEAARAGWVERIFARCPDLIE